MFPCFWDPVTFLQKTGIEFQEKPGQYLGPQEEVRATEKKARNMDGE